MTSIVMNTATMAVSEYADTGVSSMVVGGEFFVADASGVNKLDATVLVTSHMETHPRLWDNLQVRRPRYAYVAARNPDTVTVSVELANGDVFDYDAVPTEKEVLRVDLGRGIRTNYFGVHVTHTGTSDFRLDKVEIMGKELRRKV